MRTGCRRRDSQNARSARSALGWTDVPAPTDRVLSRGARTASRGRAHLCVHVQQEPDPGKRRLPGHVQAPRRPARRASRDSTEGAGRNDRIRSTRFKVATRSTLRADVGDFVISRRDRIIAYQLAVVVDDAAQRITHVVRGADLLDNTPRQLLLFRLLGAARPALRARSGSGGSQRPEAQQTDARHRGRRRHRLPTICGSSSRCSATSHPTICDGQNRPNCWRGPPHNGIFREYRGAQLTPSSCASEGPLLPSTPSAWGRSHMRRVLLLDPDVARRDRLCHGLTEKGLLVDRHRRSGRTRLHRPVGHRRRRQQGRSAVGSSDASARPARRSAADSVHRGSERAACRRSDAAGRRRLSGAAVRLRRS